MAIKSLRIIAGTWRGRQVPLLDAPGLRPTPARVRETLFNWLQGKIEDKICLDCFCGSGALGLEAMSRGAKEAVFLDQAPEVARHVLQTLQTLKAKNARVVRTNSLAWLKKMSQHPFDIVFLDPPFHHNLVPRALKLLTQNNYLAPSAYLYIETEKNPHFDVPLSLRLHKEKSTASISYKLYQVCDAPNL